MEKIGRRIRILGPTGSGKTTLAREIARRTGLPHVELDAIFWLPEWEAKPLESFREEAGAALEEYGDGWVCDGNYRKSWDVTMSRADTIIWLRLPFRVTFWRLLRRTLATIISGRPHFGNNRETIKLSFFSRDSLLLNAWKLRNQHFENIRQALHNTPHRARVITLDTPEEVKRFLEGLN